MFGNSLRLTKSATSPLVALCFLVGGSSFALAQQPAQVEILKTQVKKGGFVPADQLYQNSDEELEPVGRVVFRSKALSLNGDISCFTCHLKDFGSRDGIPVAAAIGGQGEGPGRLMSGAKLLPRRTLPFWGRGGNGFRTFFWDGRVDFSGGVTVSQFGSNPPSADPLVTAAHLPVVQIREMLDEDEFVRKHMQESTASAEKVYSAISENLKKAEPAVSADLAKFLHKDVGALTYTDYARAVAAFIRSEFRIQPTKLERFAFRGESLVESEVKGGVLFYGKGNCISCHSGPYFTDFKFHVVPFPQLGFGANGFGVDYGRFNVTFKPEDLYAFRTPPLFNVQKTAPYGHSGSAATIEDAIVAHFDPLRLTNAASLAAFGRHEFYKRLTLSSQVSSTVTFLSDGEVKDLVAFLRTLSF